MVLAGLINPPYSQPLITHFADKLVFHWRRGDVTEAIFLINSITDTVCFHTLAREATAMCFTTGRIPFVNPEGVVSAPLLAVVESVRRGILNCLGTIENYFELSKQNVDAIYDNVNESNLDHYLAEFDARAGARIGCRH